jgi:hypothetical protein
MKRTVLALLVTAGVIHCGTDNVVVQPAPKPVADGGRGEGGIDLPPPPPPPENCDLKKLPTENPCVIHESAGVFVSATKGSDDGLGTREKPLKDISKAILGASTTGRRVYACAETYEAQLTLGEGIDVFGYFDCSAATWKVIDAQAKVAPKDGVAAMAKNIDKPTRIEALDIVAADGKAPGDSSIGLIAQDSGGLSFVNTRIAAGKGRDGTDGAVGVQLSAAAAVNGADGYAETANGLVEGNLMMTTKNRPGGDGTCTGAAGHNGGNGGEGSKSGASDCRGLYLAGTCSGVTKLGVLGECYSGTALAGLPTAATATTNRGATRTETALPGVAGAKGDDGANGVGSLSAEGFKPGNGTAGKDGAPGTGGGGGASIPRDGACIQLLQWFNPTGAGGGAGGCPGLAGAPGTGGGTSIAVLAVRSPFKVDAKSQIVASSGGNGGRAGARSTPTSGGSPGANAGASPYAAGAAGGSGGEGGLSGHGAAGHSFGIAYTGPKPAADVTPTVGAAGAAAMARETEPGGAPGLAEPLHEF